MLTSASLTNLRYEKVAVSAWIFRKQTLLTAYQSWLCPARAATFLSQRYHSLGALLVLVTKCVPPTGATWLSAVTRIAPLSRRRTLTDVPLFSPASWAMDAGSRRPNELPHLQILDISFLSQCIANVYKLKYSLPCCANGRRMSAPSLLPAPTGVALTDGSCATPRTRLATYRAGSHQSADVSALVRRSAFASACS